MQRSEAEKLKTNPSLNALLEAQQQHLLEAQETAEEHSRLVNDVYAVDNEMDDFSLIAGRKLGDVEGSIIALHKQIAELECPRDDSLDNTIVVWCSQAFAPITGGATTGVAKNDGSETTVPAVCSVLEEMGYSIRRCCDEEEAIARARDLQQEGQLRCVIIGGKMK
jgi:hypothetical protein